MSPRKKQAPDVIDAGLKLLDRQIVDKDGRMCGKVDDLQLSEPRGNAAPYVTAILAGPGALARQLGGRLGHWLESVHGRLHPSEQPGPARIEFGLVRNIDNHIEISVSRDELDLTRFENWVRENVINKIPGAHHEAK